MFYSFHREVTFTDAGVYSCHATNKFGSANANGTLIVKGIKFMTPMRISRTETCVPFHSFQQSAPSSRTGLKIMKSLPDRRPLSAVMPWLIRHSTWRSTGCMQTNWSISSKNRVLSSRRIRRWLSRRRRNWTLATTRAVPKQSWTALRTRLRSLFKVSFCWFRSIISHEASRSAISLQMFPTGPEWLASSAITATQL